MTDKPIWCFWCTRQVTWDVFTGKIRREELPEVVAGTTLDVACANCGANCVQAFKEGKAHLELYLAVVKVIERQPVTQIISEIVHLDSLVEWTIMTFGQYTELPLDDVLGPLQRGLDTLRPRIPDIAVDAQRQITAVRRFFDHVPGRQVVVVRSVEEAMQRAAEWILDQDG